MAKKNDTITVRLTHHCRVHSCYGNIGDVLEVSKNDADWLLARGGAQVVESVAQEAPAPVEAKTSEPSGD